MTTLMLGFFIRCQISLIFFSNRCDFNQVNISGSNDTKLIFNLIDFSTTFYRKKLGLVALKNKISV